MNKNNINRRGFINKAAFASAAAMLANSFPSFSQIGKDTGKLAILDGAPVRSKDKLWPRWPYIDEKVVQSAMGTVNSGNWCRFDRPAESKVAGIEKDLGQMLGAKHVVTTGSGTQSLSTSVHALDIEAGDEVITSPYTDMGTVTSILTTRALPVLVDIDRESFQLDPAEVEREITSRTKAIMPVHIMGVSCDMAHIMRIARKYNLKVIEDSCQAPFAQFDGKCLGTIGNAGALSFQTTKALACGEGGIVFTNDDELGEKLFTVMNHGTDKKGNNVRIGPKYRMTELQASLLAGQIPSHMERHAIRNRNARYLTSKLKDFKGLLPQKQYAGTGDSAYYLYAMIYNQEYFNGASREQFLKAIQAEGIPLNPYIPRALHQHDWVDHITGLKSYTNSFSKKRLQEFQKETKIKPNTDFVSANIAVLSGGGPLTGSLQDMDDMVNAIMKVYENRDQLKTL